MDTAKNSRLDPVMGLPAPADLVLFFQPQVDLRSGEVVGAEALLRWDHADLGVLGPGSFLPELIAAGRLDELTRWVVREAVGEQVAWAADGLVIPISVNVPASMLADAGWRAELVALRSVAAGSVTLEVLEGERLPELPDHALEDLVAAGYLLSVDDIGTGFASLERLAVLPVTEVKLDTSLVIRSATSIRHRALVGGLARLGASLGLRVVAEGVETEAVRAHLLEAGVAFGQGFLFAPALPSAVFVAMARASRPDALRRREPVTRAWLSSFPRHSRPFPQRGSCPSRCAGWSPACHRRRCCWAPSCSWPMPWRSRAASAARSGTARSTTSSSAPST